MALAGMTLQLSIGSIYAYSIWIKPIELMNGWDAHQLKLAFSLAICFLGLTAAFMGKFVKRAGPKKAGLLGAAFFAAGLAGAGFANSMGSLPAFYLFYGVVSGIGLGFGYITPVAVVVKWFPDKPGLASGLVIMSFAAGSILASQLISPLAASFGVAGAFYILAIAYGLLMAIASFILKEPAAASGLPYSAQTGVADLSFADMLKDVRFYGLWFMLFFNTTCGIALIAVAAPMAKEVIGISDAAAIVFVGIIGLFNGLGRLIWSSVSDRIGRWNTFMAFFIIEVICFLLLTQTKDPIVFQGAVFIIISCYGGAFAAMPPFIKDIYGQERLGSVFGYILIAWSAAAFAGPTLISLSSNYSLIFYVFAGILALTALMTFLLKKQLNPQGINA